MDLAQFVSDYMAALRECESEPATERDIAVAFVDHTAQPGMSDADFHAEVERIAPQISYYL